MLGVTPELSVLGQSMTAVDINPAMIEHIWPGDTVDRRAINANWLDLPFDDARWNAVVGDGSCSSVRFAEDYDRLFHELFRVLVPSGRAVIRLYCAPSPCETLADVQAIGVNRGAGTVHALKIRLAMAWAAEHGEPNVPVTTILDEFQRWFPDRRALASINGWDLEDIGTIDAYAGSTAIYSFPTLEQVLDQVRPIFGDARVLPSGNYEMAELCPLLVIDKP
jgi:ubiquinone/menaquinone biosynthesis C-methylase UbiE